MNEINWWNGLTDEEKMVAMGAVAAFQAAQLERERINALKGEVLNDIETLYNLMNWNEWKDFTKNLTNNFPIK